MIVGQKIRMSEHPLTRPYGVRGEGIITAVRLTDPVNRRGLVIIAHGEASRCYLHLTNVEMAA